MKRLVLLFWICCFPALAAEQRTVSSLEAILDEIGHLESNSDPKCHTTANRLEDFMFGTPLSVKARAERMRLQQALAKQTWQQAGKLATAAGLTVIDSEEVRRVGAGLLVQRARQDDGLDITTPSSGTLVITARDRRQYGAVAYGLRAVLAVQQEATLSDNGNLPPLTSGAVTELKELLESYTLAALHLADRHARATDQRELTAEGLRHAWFAVGRSSSQSAAANETNQEPSLGTYATLKAIADRKVASYSAYNHIRLPIFLRNLQVFFARYRWPSDPAAGEAFKQYFNQALTFFTHDLLLAARDRAAEQDHALIRFEDMHATLAQFLPHQVNPYEDVTFFPLLESDDRITIESYDLDAFRDSGLHWLYLQAVLEQPDFDRGVEPDPFAAEVLVEGISQFGVLALRMAGQTAADASAEALSSKHLDQGLRRIQALIDRHVRAKPSAVEANKLRSSRAPVANARGGYFFSEATGDSGIAFHHRSASWLGRTLRGLLQKDATTGVLTVPPAFGGSGVAAEDIDNDGDTDILLLGGGGNALYLNDGDGRFVDVTASAGLDWKRAADGEPGEPRQPIVADFDNDGWQDILITYVDDSHRLYRNLGGYRFEDLTALAGLGGSGEVGGAATALDVDGDGLLDLYIGNFGDYLRGQLPTLARRNENGLPNRLLRNLGDMRFEDISKGSGSDDRGWTQAVAHSDFDRDGLQDLLSGNDFGVNRWLRNLGNGRFEDVSRSFGTDKPSYTMGIGIADLNGDAYPDFYISNIVTMVKDDKYVLPTEQTTMHFEPAKLASMRVVEANDLFLSRNGESYTLSDAIGRGASSTGWAWGSLFFDFDNDGDDDLYCVNGMNEYAVYSSNNPYYTDAAGRPRNVLMPVAQRESNVFFVNSGNRLINRSAASGANLLGNSRSFSYLDYDLDGDLDMIVNNFHAPAVLYRNEAAGDRHWLAVRLEGNPAAGSTRDAIGASIQLTVTNTPPQWREIHSTLGYLTSPPKTQYFGLGDAGSADLLVRWPNGDQSNFPKLTANRSYRITQGEDGDRAVINSVDE